VCVYIYIYTHTHIHPDTQTPRRRHRHTHTHTRTHAHAHTHTHTHTRTHTHTHTHIEASYAVDRGHSTLASCCGGVERGRARYTHGTRTVPARYTHSNGSKDGGEPSTKIGHVCEMEGDLHPPPILPPPPSFTQPHTTTCTCVHALPWQPVRNLQSPRSNHYSNILLLYYSTTLLLYYSTTLLLYYSTTLLLYHFATLLLYYSIPGSRYGVC